MYLPEPTQFSQIIFVLITIMKKSKSYLFIGHGVEAKINHKVRSFFKNQRYDFYFENKYRYSGSASR
jgi:hypothetical protein